MELKIKTPTFPEVIEFNFEELKKEITSKAADYVDLVYTNEQIGEAKKDRATLNKFCKALSDERIKIKKDCLKPYEEFERKIKELDGIVNKAISNIDGQIKAFEDSKKEAKMEAIKDHWCGLEKPFEVPFEKVMDSRWLNSSFALKAVFEAMDEIIERIRKDLMTLDDLPEFSFEAVEEYKRTLDLSRAISEVRRLAEIQRRKEEHEAEIQRRKEEHEAEMARRKEEHEAEMARRKAEEEARNKEEEFKQAVNAPEPALEEQKEEEHAAEWISFKALLTVENALALKSFFESQNIEFESI